MTVQPEFEFRLKDIPDCLAILLQQDQAMATWAELVERVVASTIRCSKIPRQVETTGHAQSMWGSMQDTPCTFVWPRDSPPPSFPQRKLRNTTRASGKAPQKIFARSPRHKYADMLLQRKICYS